MASSVSPRRFAQAIFQIALESKQIDSWMSDLADLVSYSKDDSFLSFMDSPKISLDSKISVIRDSGIEADLNKLAVNLLALLASRNSVYSISDIADSFEELVDKHNNVLRADITTATEISKDLETTISNSLKKIAGNDLSITTNIDPSIVGGFVARVGDRLIDASVKTRLENMKRGLVKGT
jgi:F-type H+-transporting ATPase subunit delta